MSTKIQALSEYLPKELSDITLQYCEKPDLRSLIMDIHMSKPLCHEKRVACMVLHRPNAHYCYKFIPTGFYLKCYAHGDDHYEMILRTVVIHCDRSRNRVHSIQQIFYDERIEDYDEDYVNHLEDDVDE